jgi:aerobic-type carbon monoxide dehydrogenase small subunit (CoxS/CutS family)
MKMTREIILQLNGREEKVAVEDADTLLEVLRDRFKLWSVREGCGVGACGTCTVLLDGRPVSSCFLLAVRAAGREILTLEGLSDGKDLHAIQEAFVTERALQCAYCTPGFVLSVKALLDEIPDPSDDEIREYLSGNLCRCAGYADILRAIRVGQVSSKRA